MTHLFTKTLLTVSAISLLAACSQANVEAAAESAADKTKNVAAKTTAAVETALTPDKMISEIPSGTYKSESGHAYIAFTYSHQGYSNPIVRWGKFDATLMLDNEAPTNSTLSVNIDPKSVDTGVPKFDEHLLSADFFDVANHPNITFTSTSLKQMAGDKGTVTGDLMMNGVTKPITLDVTLNKVGKNFRSSVPMFGISATGALKRSDWGIDKYTPMAEDVKLKIEVEFQLEE